MSILVTHGDWVWKLALVVLTGLGFVCYQVIRRVRAGRKVRAEILHLSDRASTNGVVRGVLRDGAVRTLTNGAGEHASELSGEPWLDCDGRRVELGAPMRVECGSRRECGLWRAPAAASATLRARVRRVEPLVLTSIEDGDEFFAVGHLAREQDRWKLEPDYGVSTRPHVAPRAHGPLGLFGIPLVFALAIWGGLALLGQTMLDRAVQNDDPDSARYAAALPGTRVRALKALYELEFVAGATRDATMRAQRRALARLAFDEDRVCDDLPETLDDLSDLALEVADEVGPACGQATRAGDLLILRGEHARAVARAPERTLTGWHAAVLSGDWQRAGAPRSDKPDEQCVLDLFRWWGGDRSIRPSLIERAKTNATCAFAATETMSLPERATVRAQLSDGGLVRPLMWWRDLTDGVAAPDADSSRQLATEVVLPGIWFGPAILRRWTEAGASDEQRRALTYGHAFVGLLERIRGDAAAAAVHFGKMKALAPVGWADVVETIPGMDRRTRRRALPIDNGADYVAWIDSAATRRDGARARSDRAAPSWQRIVERHVSTLSDRRVLTAILLIQYGFGSLRWEGAR